MIYAHVLWVNADVIRQTCRFRHFLWKRHNLPLVFWHGVSIFNSDREAAHVKFVSPDLHEPFCAQVRQRHRCWVVGLAIHQCALQLGGDVSAVFGFCII